VDIGMSENELNKNSKKFGQIIYDMIVLLPWTILDANSRCRDLVKVFEKSIDPILMAVISDISEREILRARLLPAGAKGAFLMQNFAKLAGVQFSSELGILAGIFTRVYDDLIDSDATDNLCLRITDLFMGKEFEPSDEREELFLIIFQSIESLLPKSVYINCYRALQDVHYFQLRSRRQTSPIYSAKMLSGVTTSKGAKGTLVLFSMIKAKMAEKEIALIEELGACFQYLDDYEDCEEDKGSGVFTLATAGTLTFKQIALWLAKISSQLEAYYGQANARFFIVGLFYWLSMAWIVRLLSYLHLRRTVEYRNKMALKYWFPVQLLFS
jgi:hypothetical protein